MTWANQIRILKQQFEALGAIIGQNFIYALKPVVTALNTVMSKLIQFARVVSNSLGKIFGWKYEDTTGGIADDLEFGAEAADDLGSGLGGAADKAKKLKQQLQGFDELNVLASNTPSSGGGGGGGALGDTDVSATGGQWVRDTEEKFFESDLDTLYKLGDHIGTTLTNQLRSIDWQEVYQGAKDFGSGLASFLNGLISVDLFSATGATIAGALNTAIYSSLAFGETFDFEEFGLSIAEGINTFFRDTDFSALGQDIKTWVNGLKTTLITIIKEVEWGEILSGIGDVLKSLDAETIATLFAFGALSMLFKRSLFSTLGTALSSVTTLPAALTTGLATIGTNIRVGFIGGLSAAFVGFKLGEWIYEHITGDDTSDINYLDYFLGDGKASAEEWWGAIKEYIKNDIVTIEDGSLADAVLMSLQGKSANEIASKRNGEPTKKIEEFAKDISKQFGSASKTVDTFTKKYSKDMQEVVKSTRNSFGTLNSEVPGYATTIKDGVTKQWENLKTSTGNAYTWIKEKVLGETQTTANGMKVAYKSANDSIKITSADTTSDIVAKYKAMRENVVGNSDAMKNSVNRNSNSIKITSADTTSDIVAKYKAMRTNNEKEASTMAANVVGSLTKLKSGAETETKGLDSSLVSKFQNAKTGADTNFKGILNSVNTNIGGAKSIVEKQNWYSSGSNLVAGLAKGLSDKWNDTSGSGLVGKIVSLASGLTSALKRAFGIHSPSRLWDEEIGQMLPAGIGKGVLKGEDALNTDIINMGARLTDTMSGALTLATPSRLSSNFDFGVTSTMAHNFSADTSMTSNIADGVRQGLANSQAEQNELLREQNQLLMQILEKTGISSSDLFNAVRRESRQHYNQTGTSAFVY